jgi:hypothetical protein
VLLNALAKNINISTENCYIGPVRLDLKCFHEKNVLRFHILVWLIAKFVVILGINIKYHVQTLLLFVYKIRNLKLLKSISK